MKMYVLGMVKDKNRFVLIYCFRNEREEVTHGEIVYEAKGFLMDG